MSDETMTREHASPVNVTSQTIGDVQTGLGSSRYKEYDIPGYAQLVRARVPAAVWSGVYYSWLSMKGHLQGLHSFDRSEFFATSYPDGDVEAVFMVIWDDAEALAEWIENGHPVDLMLKDIGLPDENVSVQLMRDFS